MDVESGISGRRDVVLAFDFRCLGKVSRTRIEPRKTERPRTAPKIGLNGINGS
jgi:hypothetical protein